MTQQARIAVIGGGAMGGIAAAAAYEAGQDVTLCVRTPISRLTIEADSGTKDFPVHFATAPEQAEPADIVLLATKAQDTEGAVPWLKKLLKPGSILGVLQNGVEHEERVRAFAGSARVVPALLYIGGELLSPGRIRHFTGNRMVVPENPDAARLVPLFAKPRLDVVPSADFLSAAWRKLLLNAAGNTVTTLTMQRIRIMSENEAVKKLARDLMVEIMTVGRAEGAKLGEKDIEFAFKAFADAKDTGSSMLYDRMSGRSLEHEHLSGAVLRAARRHGIETPLLAALHALLDGLDKSR